MCGIVGYLNLNGQALDPDRSLLQSMCKSIFHRGPDEEGSTIMGPVALGMTRLSIIDLTTGQQPIANEDETVWIVFNGEIYNFKELQKHVLERGHKLRTKSDTEIIVHLYEEYGVECLGFLEGMFSFAIWDDRKQRLFIARDRMGEKPLHWGVFDGQLIFGSEIKSILTHPRSKRELDQGALQKYLALEYVPAPSSIFKGINKLMPAHFMLVEKGQVRTECYWEPKVNPIKQSEEEAKERLVELLDRSVELRLISDVPLGTFLSGGLDSSIITALAARKSSKPVKTFSIGFADPSFDESQFAQAVSQHLNTDHKIVTFVPELAYQTMEELWNVLDEPIADASIVPTFFLSKMTREHVTVSLAGEGGDELFGGYPTYWAHKLASLWNTVPPLLREGLLEPAIRSLPVSLNNLSFDYKAKRFIASAGQPPVRRHVRWMGSIPLTEHSKLIKEAGTCTAEEQLFADATGAKRVLMPKLSNGLDVVDTIMRFDLSTYLPDDLLVKSDRASMAASLELRLPFLAYPLVEFALSLPSDLKVRGITTKYLLKKAALPYLPERTVKRPKKGFGIPVGKWLRNEFKPLVDDLLCEQFVKQQGIFNWEYIKDMRREHEAGHADRRKELWTLLMFQRWWKKFFA